MHMLKKLSIICSSIDSTSMFHNCPNPHSLLGLNTRKRFLSQSAPSTVTRAVTGPRLCGKAFAALKLFMFTYNFIYIFLFHIHRYIRVVMNFP